MIETPIMMNSKAATPTPAPMPALAPVDRPPFSDWLGDELLAAVAVIPVISEPVAVLTVALVLVGDAVRPASTAWSLAAYVTAKPLATS